MTLALGAFLFTVSFTKVMIGDLKSINEMAKTKQSDADIFKQLSQFIRTQSDSQQLSE